MEPIVSLVALLGALALGAMSPGPSFVLVARTAIARSRSDGLAAAVGMGIGGVIFAVLVVLGLHAVLSNVPRLYLGLKVAGGIYLLYLGIRIWRGAREPPRPQARRLGERALTVPLQMGPREWLLLGTLSVLWGCSFLFVELALRELPVFTVALGRTGIAAASLLLLLATTRAPLLPLVQRWREFLLLGALRAAIPMSLIVWAQTRIDSGVAGILNSTSPLFTMVIAHLLTSDDRLTPQKLIGCLIGIVGVVVMIGMEFLNRLGDGIAGQLAMLGAACSYGFAAVYGRRFDTGSNMASAAGMLSAATLLILPVALVIDRPWTLSPGSLSISALFGLALLSTAIAFVVWFRLITTAGPSNTSLVTFLIPFTALGLGILLLGEKPTLGSVLGLVILLAGLALTQRKSSRSKARAPGGAQQVPR
jgi:drug/metabolite transporter (DMT)-like permease